MSIIHPFSYPFIQLRAAGVLEPSPGVTGWEAGHILARLPVNHRADPERQTTTYSPMYIYSQFTINKNPSGSQTSSGIPHFTLYTSKHNSISQILFGNKQKSLFCLVVHALQFLNLWITLTWVCLDCGRILLQLEKKEKNKNKTYAGTGRTCKLHTETPQSTKRFEYLLSGDHANHCTTLD